MRPFLTASLWVLLGAYAAEAGNAADVGFVLEMRGAWILDGSKSAVLIGQALPSSGKIMAASPQADAKITVVLLDGKTIVRDCYVKEQCLKPIVLPAAYQSESSAWSRLVKAIGVVFKHEPTRYQPMISRSTHALSDSVVELRNGSVDLAPAFRRMKPSPYQIIFSPLEEKASLENRRVTYVWNPTAPVRVPLEGFKSGVFRITVSSSSSSAEAWCLLAEPQNFARWDAEFRQATSITESWNLPSNSPAVRAFLRACLQHLQESAQ